MTSIIIIIAVVAIVAVISTISDPYATTTFITQLSSGYSYEVRKRSVVDERGEFELLIAHAAGAAYDTYFCGTEEECHERMRGIISLFEAHMAYVLASKAPEVAPLPEIPEVLANMAFYFSGHLGRRYPSEQLNTSSCGSCDGAQCDYCDKVWVVGEERFFDQAEAVAAAQWLGSSLRQLVGSKELAERSHFDFYLNAENHLCVLGGDSGEEEFVCNPQSHLYEEKWLAALESKERFNACPCVNKNEDNYANSCCRVGCNDLQCWAETQRRGRTTKKWYM